MEPKMSKGKVREYDPNRGFGVIIDTETGQQLSVYANYVNLPDGDVLKKDLEVEYEMKNDRHGNWASNVRLAQA